MLNKSSQPEGWSSENKEESDRNMSDDITLVNELRRVFVTNNWPIDEQDAFEGGGPFERTTKMLTKLKDDEINLILDLLRRFVRFEFEQYLLEMKRVVAELVKDIDPEKVAIIPIKSSKDMLNGKSKSGDMMGIIARSAFTEQRVRAEAYNDIKSRLLVSYVGQPGSYFIGVDDFIGTGDTASSFIDSYIATFPAHLHQLKLMSLVSLEQGAATINSLGCELFCHHKISKGISDFGGWTAREKLHNIEIMARIEERIKFGNGYSMGYGRSEGLVKMMRTPNNTFPVFWTTGLHNGVPWPATFPR